MKSIRNVIAVSALSVFVLGSLFSSCRKTKGEPNALICTSESIYQKGDTIKIVNCSENFTKQRWRLPDGTQSTAPTIYYVPPTIGAYKFTLYVSNEDYIYDYESTKFVEVVP